MKKYKFLIIVFLLFLSFWSFVFLTQQVWQYQAKKNSRIAEPAGIHSLEKVTLGGVDQWILIRGRDRTKPVLLFLHGGPGSALFPRARDLGVGLNLEKHAVMVYWEQRGTGKSYNSSIPVESMTIEQLENDTVELTRILIERFHKQKIILVGRSFGSLIGIKAAGKHPELYHSFTGVGQMIWPLKNDSLSYDRTLALARQYDNQKAIRELQQTGYPPYIPKQLLVQRRWLTVLYDKMMKEKFNVRSRNQWKVLLSTPEYTLPDIFRMGMNPFFSINYLWNDKFYRVNLFEQIPRLEIPFYFIAGQYDYFTSPELVTQYYQKLDAPNGKHLILFDKSGHQPESEQPDKFYEVMVNQVLKDIKE
ncbi:alpha/beta hydrolase [candidate division KSB1 bacterium]|nr:alpha/beta hydrolase [candidate division KSB1 bacterium]